MTSTLSSIPVSVLDLATIIQGDQTPAEAFHRSLYFAKQAEKLGFTRYWFAEHHNMESVASSATAVLIGYVASGTSKIRLGSGGIMLPNHAPLVIAEQFGTLESLYPGRIDLGVGRAPGTDQVTSHALRRSLKGDVNDFPNDVVELINYLGPENPDSKVKAVPGQGTEIPVWILGSSTFGAQLAAQLGLPFAFASHFAPAYLLEALYLYHKNFQPSRFLKEPHAMACVNVIIADNQAEADYLATSLYQMVLGMFRNTRKPLPPPVHSMEILWNEMERQAVFQMLQYSFRGDLESVQESLEAFVAKTQVNELMVTSHIYDVNAKSRSMEQIAGLFRSE